jgi:hypothetical protein
VLDQAEIKLRIRAAMALADIRSYDALADRLDYSRSTIKDLGTKRGKATEAHLRVIARACGVPYAWFTVPDLRQVVAGAGEDPSLAERVEALEGRMRAVEKRLG